MKFIALALSILSCVSTPASAANYKYSDLIIKDYDEMNQEVQKHIKRADAALKRETKAGDEQNGVHLAVEELREALKLIFSRPNSDNMVTKLISDVRRDLGQYSAFDDTISSLTAEELGYAKDKNATVSQRSTALFVLENILSEIRPEAANNEDMRRVIQRIADAKLRIEKDVANDRKVRSMYNTVNPSELAREILDGLAKPKK